MTLGLRAGGDSLAALAAVKQMLQWQQAGRPDAGASVSWPSDGVVTGPLAVATLQRYSVSQPPQPCRAARGAPSPAAGPSLGREQHARRRGAVPGAVPQPRTRLVHPTRPVRRHGGRHGCRRAAADGASGQTMACFAVVWPDAGFAAHDHARADSACFAARGRAGTAQAEHAPPQKRRANAPGATKDWQAYLRRAA